MNRSALFPVAVLTLAAALAGCRRPQSQPAEPCVSAGRGSKGPPPPQSLLHEAQLVHDAFVEALRASAWEPALALCSPTVQAAARESDSAELFFQRTVPIQKLLARTDCRCRWTFQAAGLYFIQCLVRLTEQPPISWEWFLRRSSEQWTVDFQTDPLDAWLARETDHRQRAYEEYQARLAPLLPKLEGVRTQLTALIPEFRVGQPMLFRLELVNGGSSELAYEAQQVAVNASMTITRADGQTVPYTAVFYQTGDGLRPIKPGETAVLFDAFDISQQYDLARPGRYRVQFSGHGLQVGERLVPGERELVADRPFPSNVVEIDVKR